MVRNHRHVAHLKCIRSATARSRAAGGGGRTVCGARIACRRAAVIGIRPGRSGGGARLASNLDLVANMSSKVIGASGQRVNGSRGAVRQGVAPGRTAQTSRD
jgi:hypothetical protein